MVRWLVLALLLLGLAGCERSRSAPPARIALPPAGSLRLPIPDRTWAPEAPPEGWCGEASIQMAALHYGAWIPQATINRLGRPRTPDLWEYDVPVALEAIGLRYEPFQGGADPQLFLGWVVQALQARFPVVLGLKIYPTAHPDWDVDHLVLVAGFEPGGLVLNANAGEGQLTWPWAGLRSKAPGYSIIGPAGRHWGFAVKGFAPSEGRVRVRVAEEEHETAYLEVAVEGLEAGGSYLLVRDDLAGTEQRTPFVASGPAMTFAAASRSDRAARFSCRRGE